MNDNKSIAYKIKKFRKAKNMSQDELSNASEINISTIKKYESGDRNPKPDQLLKIANALSVSINSLIEFELTTVSDVISLLMRMDEQSNMIWNGQKDSNGKYIPSSITISFDDDKLNEALSTYMEYRDIKLIKENNDENTLELTLENQTINLDETKNRLLLFSDNLKKIE